MKHELKIIEAFKANEIARVLLVDDAFDAPSLNEVTGEFVDFLEKEENQSLLLENGISEEIYTAAIHAAHEGNAEDQALEAVNKALYDRFLINRDPTVDPDGRFSNLKSASLDYLSPLLKLLNKCGEGVSVEITGLQRAQDVFTDFRPEIVFLDFFLAREGATSDPSARKESVELLRWMIEHSNGNEPAVILMSSKAKAKSADGFRKAVSTDRNQVLALRFQFLQKDWIKEQKKDTDSIEIEHSAADVLLDISQGFSFGNHLRDALRIWKNGAEQALIEMLGEIAKLEPKDFAYMLRFRLFDEGQPLSAYLEWMFGEDLRAHVARKVNWSDKSFVNLNEESLIDHIEGAFDGPSKAIAEIYHRIRISNQPPHKNRHHALGDLFIDKKEKSLRAVITGDCDLIPRRSGSTKVNNVLTIGGDLKKLDTNGASAESLMLHEGKPYSLSWRYKDLQTLPVKGPGSLIDDERYDLVGTLRPIYAQEVQQSALTDLGRPGLAVPPAMGFNVKVSAFVRVPKGKGKGFEEIDVDGKDAATIMLSRNNKDSHRAILRRSYIHRLADAIGAFDREKLTEEDRSNYDSFLDQKNYSKFTTEYLGNGVKLGENGPSQSVAFIGKAASLKHDRWLQFVFSPPGEMLEELSYDDPTEMTEQ